MIGKRLLHYTIREPLGEGGMAEVWLAHDGKLGRLVAIKILPAEVTRDKLLRARLEREARSLASLVHPNIVTLYSLEEDDGVLFLVMEYVQGSTLDEAMPDGGYEESAFFDLALQLVDGLAAAHGEGIVHRDLKPSNVIVDASGRLRLLDFGLARREVTGERETVAMDEGTTDALTSAGMVLGTVPYMAPEQLKGEPPTQRSDIFSLGATFFEMLAGRRLFSGKTSAEIVTSILRDDPPDLSDQRPGLPRHLFRLIRRCLEKDPEHRYESASHVQSALQSIEREIQNDTGNEAPPTSGARRESRLGPTWRWLVLAAVVLLSVTAGVLVLRSLDSTRSAGTTMPLDPSDSPIERNVHRTLLVVVPFENVGSEAGALYSEGMADEIRARLSSVEGLGVISRRSSAEYAAGHWSREELKASGVDFMLDGTVRWENRGSDGENRMKVTAALVSVADGTQHWSGSFLERTLEGVFSAQATIAEAVRSELDLAFGAVSPSETPPTTNQEAYAAYLRGMDARTKVVLGRLEFNSVGVAEFQLATTLDPNFVPAWARLARSHAFMYARRLDKTPARIKLAEGALEVAERLAPDSAEANMAAAVVARLIRRDYDTALARLASAARLRPGDGSINAARAQALRGAGRMQEALTEAQNAAKLDPRNAERMIGLGWAHIVLRDFEAAAGPIDQALRLAPNSPSANLLKSRIIFHRQGLEALDDFHASSPLSEQPATVRFCVRAAILSAFGQFEELIEGSRLLPDLGCPSKFRIHPKQLIRGAALELQGLADEARIAFQSARATLESEIDERPDDFRLFAALSQVHAHLGERDKALRAAREAIALEPLTHAVDGWWPFWSLAVVHAILGDIDEALTVLEDIFAAPTWFSERELLVNPVFAVLRGHPRMLELVKDLEPVSPSI